MGVSVGLGAGVTFGVGEGWGVGPGFTVSETLIVAAEPAEGVIFTVAEYAPEAKPLISTANVS